MLVISGSIPTDCMGLFWEITQLSLWDYCMLRDCMLCFQNFGLHDLSNKPSDIATCNYSRNSSKPSLACNLCVVFDRLLGCDDRYEAARGHC
jgi:hypothetical protein